MGIGSSVTCVTESFSTAAPKPIATASHTGSYQGTRSMITRLGEPSHLPSVKRPASVRAIGGTTFRICRSKLTRRRINRTTMAKVMARFEYGDTLMPTHLSAHTTLDLLAFICFCVFVLAKTIKLVGVCIFCAGLCCAR